MFHEKLFRSIGIRVFALNGAMSQHNRTNTFFQLVAAKTGILLATNVALRGLDFPAVYWVLQYDLHLIQRNIFSITCWIRRRVINVVTKYRNGIFRFIVTMWFSFEKDWGWGGWSLYFNIEIKRRCSSNYELKQCAHAAMAALYRRYGQRRHTVFDDNEANKHLAATSFCLDQSPANTYFHDGPF